MLVFLSIFPLLLCTLCFLSYRWLSMVIHLVETIIWKSENDWVVIVHLNLWRTQSTFLLILMQQCSKLPNEENRSVHCWHFILSCSRTEIRCEKGETHTIIFNWKNKRSCCDELMKKYMTSCGCNNPQFQWTRRGSDKKWSHSNILAYQYSWKIDTSYF